LETHGPAVAQGYGGLTPKSLRALWNPDQASAAWTCTSVSPLDGDQGGVLGCVQNQKTRRGQKMTEVKEQNRPTTKRKRPHIARTRLSDEELDAFETRAQRAEISLSALIRHAVLNQKPPRASRQPSADRIELARLNASLGDLAQALRDAAEGADQPALAALIEAAHRDIAAMSLDCRRALGKGP